MHWSFTDENQTVTINLAENSSTQKVWGTVQVGILTYPVNGLWEASNGGGIAARKVSTLHLGGFVELAGGAMNFVAVSGHIDGHAPTMTGFDLKVHVAASGISALSQETVRLTTSVTAEPPPETNPPSGGTPGMSWMFCDLGGHVQLDVLVGEGGSIGGNLTVNNAHVVHGWWGDTGFEMLGQHEVSPGAFDLLGATGVFKGPASWPQQVDISGSVASISNASNDEFQATLLPMYRDDPVLLAEAYAESYMVIQMGGTHGDSQAVAGWKGPVDGSGNVGPFGSVNYRSAGTALSADDLAGIVSPSNLPDTNEISVPAFQSAAGTRPVMIQFIGPAEHFPQPPLQEYHEKITKIFYDTAAGALVLQFADVAGGGATSQINFNEGRKKNHNSVIIEPR